ncbi:MAG TPA: VWA domain-containing protein [Blastocatellia bacterium]|nr:VWA domain-containing protein [Blastocatellia bacterium]
MNSRSSESRRDDRNASLRSLCAASFALILLTVSVPAQSGRQPAQQPGNKPTDQSVIRVETREVRLPLRAWGPAGEEISDLQLKDLLVVEEGKPCTITSLKHEVASIVLVLDLSNEFGIFKNGRGGWYRNEKERIEKPGERTKAEVLSRPAALELADNFVRRLADSDQLAIIQYSDKVQLVQDWTGDHNEALSSLKSKFRAGIKSSFYDALIMAAEKLNTRESGRRVIVLVSDGLDSASRAQRGEALSELRRAQTSVFIIGWAEVLRVEARSRINQINATKKDGIEIIGPVRPRQAELRRFLSLLDGATVQLREIAETSGGEILLPETFEDFVITPQRVIKDIGAQYTLTYLTEYKPNLETLRNVQVFSRRPGLTLRTRTNYEINDAAQTPSIRRSQLIARK